MKNKSLFFIQVFFTILTIAVVSVFASQAGSSEDPLVAKSYVDDKIDQVLKKIESGSSISTGTSSAVSAYTPVYVELGKTVFGVEGTEIILRSGNAKADIPAGVDGLTNITIGKNLINGDKINQNNLIIVPRNDGRGIKTTENSWFLIKGGYTIK